jgi:hypothetical protein
MPLADDGEVLSDLRTDGGGDIIPGVERGLHTPLPVRDGAYRDSV